MYLQHSHESWKQEIKSMGARGRRTTSKGRKCYFYPPADASNHTLAEGRAESRSANSTFIPMGGAAFLKP